MHTAPTLRRTMLGGLIGTIVITAMMYYVSPRIAGSSTDIPAMLGTFLGGSWVAGLIAHLAIGVLVLSALYWCMYRWLMGTPVVRGLFFGTLLFLASQLLVGPLLGAGPFSAYAGGIPAVLDSLILHLTYGLVVGMIAGRPERSGAAWMHPADLGAIGRRARWAGGGLTTHWRVR